MTKSDPKRHLVLLHMQRRGRPSPLHRVGHPKRHSAAGRASTSRFWRRCWEGCWPSSHSILGTQNKTNMAKICSKSAWNMYQLHPVTTYCYSNSESYCHNLSYWVILPMPAWKSWCRRGFQLADHPKKVQSSNVYSSNWAWIDPHSTPLPFIL